MIFGEAVDAADPESADWIAAACRGADWTVGSIVPNHYRLVVRVGAPEPDVEDWWSAYRRLFDTVAAVGARHTETPDDALFAVWEGHGFDTVDVRIAPSGPLDAVASLELQQERSQLREDNQRRTDSIRASLGQVPRFAMPHRTYYLLSGPVAAATQIRDPSGRSDWLRPDLFWPADRSWFVGTDVDFWSLYIGGDHNFLSDLVRSAPSSTEFVPLEQELEREDRRGQSPANRTKPPEWTDNP